MLNLPIKLLAMGLLLLPIMMGLLPVLIGVLERAKQGPKLKYAKLSSGYHYKDESRTVPEYHRHD